MESQTANRLYISSISQAEIPRGILLLPAGRRRGAIEAAAKAMFAEEFASSILAFGSDAACPMRRSPWNDAGFTWDNVIQKMQDEQWQTILDVHLTAPFRILRAASAYIRDAAKKERAAGQVVFRKVVNISSISGMLGVAGQANYSSAKAGIIGLTKAMAKEWGRYHVNVNCVAFGVIETRLAQALGTDQAQIDVAGRKIAIGIHPANLAAQKQSIPLGRTGTPEEAAGAACLFCYPESNYVSGQVITCAGGLV